MFAANSPLVSRVIAFVFLLALAIASRVVWHLPNMTPLIAIAMMAGMCLPRLWAMLLMLLAMLVSDGLLACLHGYAWFGSWSWFTYSGLMGIALVGSLLSLRSQFLSVLLVSLLSGFGYWLWTNFAVWLLSDMYPTTLSGFVACYTLALPFLQHQLLATVFWIVVLFGVVKIVLLPRINLLFRNHRI